MEGRDIAVPDQDLRISPDECVIKESEEPVGSISSPHSKYSIYGSIGKKFIEVRRSLNITSCQVSSSSEHFFPKLHPDPVPFKVSYSRLEILNGTGSG